MTTKKNELALLDKSEFRIAKPFDGLPPEELEELQDQMEDLEDESAISCRMIKSPAGGKLAYEVQGDEEGDEEYLKDIDGVVIFTHRVNGYWPNAYGTSSNPEDKVPVCFSMDGKTGIWGDTGEVRTCENCPMNQFGSAAAQKGEQAKGKACKNMRRIYMMRNGDPNFYLLTVPPTSIKEVNKSLNRILAKGIPYTGLLLTFKLSKATNAGGIDYSTVVIEKKGILSPEIAAVAKEMRRQIKAKYKEMAISLDDYTPAAAPARNGGVDVIPDDEETAAMDGSAFEEAPPHGDEDAPLPFA